MAGFKHQVRALLASEGMPLLGDAMYGGEPAHTIRRSNPSALPPRTERSVRDPRRSKFRTHPSLVALHAATLQFPHPIQGYPPLLLRAPLPAEWTQHAPEAMAAAAKRALSVPVGIGPLWDDQPEDSSV